MIIMHLKGRAWLNIHLQLSQSVLDIEQFKQIQLSGTSPSRTVNDLIVDTIAKLNENIKLRRISVLTSPNGGVVCSYVHRVQEGGDKDAAWYWAIELLEIIY
jgi:translation elongation factor EF-Ts